MNKPPPRRRNGATKPVNGSSTSAKPVFLPPDGGVDFSGFKDQLATIRAQCEGIDFASKAGYDLGKAAIGECKSLRSKIERKRKELKKPALDWGVKVDAAAKELMGLVQQIEQPLLEGKLQVDRAEEAKRKEEERRKREEEERRLRQEREEAERVKREAEEATQKLREEREQLERLKAEQTKAAPEAEATPAPSNAGGSPPPRRTLPRDNPRTIDDYVAKGCTITIVPNEAGAVVRMRGPFEGEARAASATEALTLVLSGAAVSRACG